MVKIYHCPRVYVSKDANDDIDMRVVDEAKDPNKRTSLDIGKIHLRLSIAENWVRKDHAYQIGTQNLAAVDISFEVSTGNHKEGHRRTFITFPLKIPSHRLYTTTESIAHLRKELPRKTLAAGTTRSYQLMQERYHKGHRLLGQGHCGHKPKFTGEQGDGQYVMHSEQALMNYLSTEACQAMLANRIVTILRAQNLAKHGDVVKIYTIGLHIHSTKTVCGPCERSLVGVHNSTDRDTQAETPQFLEVFKKELANRMGRSSIDLITSEKLSMFTTYTANRDAKNHTKSKKGTSILVQRQEMNRNPNRIFLCNYGFELDEEYLESHEPDLDDRTLFASASKQNKNTRGSNAGLEEAREQEDKILEDIRHCWETSN